MNTLTVLLQQIGMFVIYIITGVILIRTKVLTRENLEIISKVVIKLSLPVMIFINTVNGVDRKSFFSSLSILGIAVVMYVCLLILGTLSGKVFHLHGEHLQLYRAMTVFGNVGFMGIPIVVSIYPEKGMLYMAVFTIIDQLMLWTLGVKLTSSEKESGTFNPKKTDQSCNGGHYSGNDLCTDRNQDPTGFKYGTSEDGSDSNTTGNDLSGRCFCLH